LERTPRLVDRGTPPGEVLVSRTVADLLAGSDFNFHEHGEHELKGVPGTWNSSACSTDQPPEEHL
jgi:class 3 adenylate cyclase